MKVVSFVLFLLLWNGCLAQSNGGFTASIPIISTNQRPSLPLDDNVLLDSYSFEGCASGDIIDANINQPGQHSVFFAANNTCRNCAILCTQQGYVVAATLSTQCHCLNYIPTPYMDGSNSVVANQQCNIPCPGSFVALSDSTTCIGEECCGGYDASTGTVAYSISFTRTIDVASYLLRRAMINIQRHSLAVLSKLQILDAGAMKPIPPANVIPTLFHGYVDAQGLGIPQDYCYYSASAKVDTALFQCQYVSNDASKQKTLPTSKDGLQVSTVPSWTVQYPPVVSTCLRRPQILNYGRMDLWHGWIDLQGQGRPNDYCRYVDPNVYSAPNALPDLQFPIPAPGSPERLVCTLAGHTERADFELANFETLEQMPNVAPLQLRSLQPTFLPSNYITGCEDPLKVSALVQLRNGTYANCSLTGGGEFLCSALADTYLGANPDILAAPRISVVLGDVQTISDQPVRQLYRSRVYVPDNMIDTIHSVVLGKSSVSQVITLQWSETLHYITIFTARVQEDIGVSDQWIQQFFPGLDRRIRSRRQDEEDVAFVGGIGQPSSDIPSILSGGAMGSPEGIYSNNGATTTDESMVPEGNTQNNAVNNTNTGRGDGDGDGGGGGGNNQNSVQKNFQEQTAIELSKSYSTEDEREIVQTVAVTYNFELVTAPGTKAAVMFYKEATVNRILWIITSRARGAIRVQYYDRYVDVDMTSLLTEADRMLYAYGEHFYEVPRIVATKTTRDQRGQIVQAPPVHGVTENPLGTPAFITLGGGLAGSSSTITPAIGLGGAGTHAGQPAISV